MKICFIPYRLFYFDLFFEINWKYVRCSRTVNVPTIFIGYTRNSSQVIITFKSLINEIAVFVCNPDGGYYLRLRIFPEIVCKQSNSRPSIFTSWKADKIINLIAISIAYSYFWNHFQTLVRTAEKYLCECDQIASARPTVATSQSKLIRRLGDSSRTSAALLRAETWKAFCTLHISCTECTESLCFRRKFSTQEDFSQRGSSVLKHAKISKNF